MLRETRPGFLEDDIMSFNEFKTRLLLFVLKEQAVLNQKRVTHRLKSACKAALKEIERAFDDTDGNFERWLYNEPCIMRRTMNGKPVFIEIGNSVEGIYEFLIFRKQLNIDSQVYERLQMNVLINILRG